MARGARRAPVPPGSLRAASGPLLPGTCKRPGPRSHHSWRQVALRSSARGLSFDFILCTKVTPLTDWLRAGPRFDFCSSSGYGFVLCSHALAGRAKVTGQQEADRPRWVLAAHHTVTQLLAPKAPGHTRCLKPRPELAFLQQIKHCQAHRPSRDHPMRPQPSLRLGS